MASRWQDKLTGAADAAARGVGKAARVVHGVATSPEAKRAGAATVHAVGTVVRKAVPVVQDAARKAAPVIKQAAEKAAPVVERAAAQAGHAAHEAATRVRDGYRQAARERALGGAAQRRGAGAEAQTEDSAPSRADGRPRVSVNEATGQSVETEVYVINDDGSRDYDVFPHDNPTSSMGPLARRIAGLMLVLAGIPMLVLPGPGLAAIAAGLALMAGKTLASPKKPPTSGGSSTPPAGTSATPRPE
ncbi:MAG: hypothetical protein KHY83_10945 [Coriobacteriia bacterium]|nr:hypothetical protein [Coriobacteriia bacterium]MBS5479164.1 hypothetical protein [Coriobacteriia bacterium]